MQFDPWGQIGDTQTEPRGQFGDMQNEPMGPKQGHYHKAINTSSIYQTTTINDLLIQKITSKTGKEDVVCLFEELIKSSMDKPSLSDLERMVIENISELFIFESGVTSRGFNRTYEYLESKTVKAIKENSFGKIVSRITEAYEQSSEPISYPQGWIQSFFARTVGSAQWDITPGNKKRPSKPQNVFHNFPQRDTDYDALLLDQVKSWMSE
jgi:hypothetical protein